MNDNNDNLKFKKGDKVTHNVLGLAKVIMIDAASGMRLPYYIRADNGLGGWVVESDLSVESKPVTLNERDKFSDSYFGILQQGWTAELLFLPEDNPRHIRAVKFLGMSNEEYFKHQKDKRRKDNE